MIFKYKAYKKLLKELGEYDSIVEIMELSVREFYSQLENSTDKEQFLKSKTIEHKIIVNTSGENYRNSIILSYIAGVYHIAETYFYSLQREYNEFIEEDKDKWHFKSGEKKLTQVINQFKERWNIYDAVDNELIDIFNYYHQLRVYFSHKKTTSIGEMNRIYDKAIASFNDSLKKEFKVETNPKKVEELDFEDYFIFTQVAKKIASQISSISYPDSKFIAASNEIQIFRKYIGNKERMFKSISNYLKVNYGYICEDDEDSYVLEIIEKLYN